MPDEAITGAWKAIYENSLLGAILVLVLVAFAWAVKQWRKDIEKMESRLQMEQDAHTKTREAWMADVRSLASLAEAVDQMRGEILRLAISGVKS